MCTAADYSNLNISNDRIQPKIDRDDSELIFYYDEPAP